MRSSACIRQFEARWLSEESVEEIVRTAWDRARASGDYPKLSECTATIREDLFEWDRTVLKGPKNRIKKLRKELESLRRGPVSLDSAGHQKEILVLIENLLEQEEIYWL